MAPPRVATKKDNMYIYTRKDGKRYKLIQNTVTVKGGKKCKVYYFVAEEATNLSKGSKEIDKLPEGYKITELGRAGNHPILSRIVEDDTNR